MHLENEGWALCPVKPTFKVPQLVEFRRLNRAAPKRFSSPKKKESSVNSAMVSPFDATVGGNSDEEEDVFADREGAVYDEETEDGFFTDDDDDENGSEDLLRREMVNNKSGGDKSG